MAWSRNVSRIVVTALFLTGVAGYSSVGELDRLRQSLSCTGVLTNTVHRDVKEDVTLTVAPYDRTFLEGRVQHYWLGVDTYYLRRDGIAMVISNTQSKATAIDTVGFLKSGNPKVRTANLHYYEPQTDGSQNVVQVLCVLEST